MANSFQIQTQLEKNWCWAAVAATVSSYFFPTKAMQQCQIATSVTGIPDCCNGSGACDQFETLTISLGAVQPKLTVVTTPSKIPFGNVQQQIDSGLPVCVFIQWFGEITGHFVIVSGYSIDESGTQWVDVSDPYFEDSNVPYEQLVSNYLEAGSWNETYVVSQN